MEMLNGFMIMPYLTKNEEEILKRNNKSIISDAIISKEKCDKFYRETIKVICEDIGIGIKRADEIFDEEQNIVTKIIDNIESSDIIIVDLTLLRPNVLYELGISHCLDPKKTLLITQEIIDKEIPFDIINYDRFTYDNENLSGKKLTEFKNKIKTLKEYHLKTEICLGISPFPELFLLKQRLSKTMPYLKVIELPWNQVFDEISKDERVDMVVANKTKYKLTDSPNLELRYVSQLATYESFYIISKGFEIKSFKELYSEEKGSDECLKETLRQLDKKTIVYIDKNTDYENSFEVINSIYGERLIKEIELRPRQRYRRTDKAFLDFIKSKEKCLFVGGIPERINLLKNEEYKLLIEYEDIKYIKNLASILQQENGIVIAANKNLEVKNIKDISEEISINFQKLFNQIFSMDNTERAKKLNEGLRFYNNSIRVQKFKNERIKLTISGEDFITHYINENLIHPRE